MDQQARLRVFQSQVANVRSLKSAIRQAHRSINAALRANDRSRAESFTKMYALLFCAWAEANFSKVLHTPHGFSLDEIDQVQAAKKDGISAAWKCCVRLGLRHLEAKRGSFKPNVQKRFEEMIESHVFDPSMLRNKLAHGQWVVALNRNNDAVQPDLTNRIKDLNIVTVNTWIAGHELLSGAVEHLIESPKKAFMRDWSQFVVELEVRLIAAEQSTLEEHVRRLKAKDESTGAKQKRYRDSV